MDSTLENFIIKTILKRLSHADIVFDNDADIVWVIDVKNKYWYLVYNKQTKLLSLRREFFVAFKNIFSLDETDFSFVLSHLFRKIFGERLKKYTFPENPDKYSLANINRVLTNGYGQNLGSFLKVKDNLNEAMTIDDFGRLHDEKSKILYPFKKIESFVKWFGEEYGDYAEKQGWEIFLSDNPAPNTKYKHERSNKHKMFFIVERLDMPNERQALFGQLKNDKQARDLATKTGMILDEFGVIIGWNNNLFI